MYGTIPWISSSSRSSSSSSSSCSRCSRCRSSSSSNYCCCVWRPPSRVPLPLAGNMPITAACSTPWFPQALRFCLSFLRDNFHHKEDFGVTLTTQPLSWLTAASSSPSLNNAVEQQHYVGNCVQNICSDHISSTSMTVSSSELRNYRHFSQVPPVWNVATVQLLITSCQCTSRLATSCLFWTITLVRNIQLFLIQILRLQNKGIFSFVWKFLVTHDLS